MGHAMQAVDGLYRAGIFGSSRRAAAGVGQRELQPRVDVPQWITNTDADGDGTIDHVYGLSSATS